jgi:hypothetical protein
MDEQQGFAGGQMALHPFPTSPKEIVVLRVAAPRLQLRQQEKGKDTTHKSIVYGLEYHRGCGMGSGGLCSGILLANGGAKKGERKKRLRCGNVCVSGHEGHIRPVPFLLLITGAKSLELENYLMLKRMEVKERDDR